MTTYFESCFNNIHIVRENPDQQQLQLLKIPLQQAQKDKLLLRADADPEIQRQAAIVLPRMSYQMTTMQYDPDRKLNTIGRNARKDDTDANKFKSQYNPVPYNFFFDLNVYVKNIEDGNRIVEQIIPFFTPEMTATLNLIPEMDLTVDIPIVLKSVSYEDNFDGNFPEDRRMIIWTLQFIVKGYIYGPVQTKPIIKVSKMQFYMPAGNTITSTNSFSGQIVVQPGLDANGDPTTILVNSVPYSNIAVDDNYGYIVDNKGIVISQ
jgi:hypothetical protein